MKLGYLGLLLVCFCSLAVAQSTNATISGGVTDTSGNFITEANVDIANDATGVVYSARTNNSGMYLVPVLPPGHYHVQVSKAGFKTVIKSDVVLSVQSALALNFTLPVGATSESVTIEAASAAMNTTDGSVSTVINRKFVENMPLNGRSFQDLISMTPGVTTQSPQSGSLTSTSGDFSVNGQRTESNYYMVDGVAGNISAGNGRGVPQAGATGNIPGGTALGTTQSLVSVDALEEFRVLSSTYSAEYGRSPGAQFILSTRSGTNILHGTVFDYLRNDVFDANDWFNNRNDKAQTALRQNDFGGTLGGPVLISRLYSGRDRTFFFVSYEGLRLTQPIPAVIQYVPDTCMRAKASPTLQAILNAYPVQNGVDYGTCTASVTSPSLAQFIEPYSLPAQIDSTSVRIDHRLRQNVTAFFRFEDTPSFTTARTLSSLTRSVNNTSTFTFGLTAQMSPSASNEFRIGYARANSEAKLNLDSFGGATPINLAAAVGIGAYPSTNALFQLYFPSIGTAVLNAETAGNLGRQWNLVDSYSHLVGTHSLKFGVDFRQIKSVLNYPSVSENAIFESSAAVLQGAANNLSISKVDPSTPIFHELSLYAQDEWKVSKDFHLSLGVRWELDPAPSEEHGNDPYTLSGSLSDPESVTLAPLGTPLWKTTYHNFAPRLGAAWTANRTPNFETVLRGGGGAFYDTANELATQGFQAVGYGVSKSYPNSPVPATTSQLSIAPSSAPPYTNSVVYAFPNHLQLPYTLQWNLAVQQALGKDQAFTIGYVGANGRRLAQYQEIYLAPKNPEFGYVVYLDNAFTSNYQALQAQFQRSISHGLQAFASYTWSHSLDFGSTNSALTTVRGNSDFDVRHNAQAGLSWDIAAAGHHDFVHFVTSGWGFDGRLFLRTGFPVPVNGNFVNNPATNTYYYTGVNLVQGQPVYLYGAEYPGGRIVNRAAFTSAPSGVTGDAPRNFVRGFGEQQVNLAARRSFDLRGRLALQFRAETFNLLNHPNFGYIDSALTDATFGQATMMLDHSLGTMAAQYQQGGPRSMQFALKVVF